MAKLEMVYTVHFGVKCNIGTGNHMFWSEIGYMFMHDSPTSNHPSLLPWDQELFHIILTTTKGMKWMCHTPHGRAVYH